MNVQELVVKYQAGDNAAGWELIISQENLLHQLIGRVKLGPTVDPEDLFSEIQLTLMGDLKSYDPSLSGLSRFVTLVFWRSLRRTLDRLSNGGILPLADVCVQPEPEKEIDDQEQLALLADAMQQIPPLYRMMLEMHFDNQTRQQIVEAANATLGREIYTEHTIKPAINDAIWRLKIIMNPELDCD